MSCRKSDTWGVDKTRIKTSSSLSSHTTLQLLTTSWAFLLPLKWRRGQLTMVHQQSSLWRRNVRPRSHTSRRSATFLQPISSCKATQQCGIQVAFSQWSSPPSGFTGCLQSINWSHGLVTVKTAGDIWYCVSAPSSGQLGLNTKTLILIKWDLGVLTLITVYCLKYYIMILLFV